MAKNTTTSNTTVVAAAPAATKEVKKTAKKAETKVEAVAPVAAVATETVKKVTKKAETKVEAVVAPVAPVAVPAADASSDASVSWQDELKVVQNGLESLIATARTLLSSTKRLQKQAEREIKDARKKSKKTRKEVDGATRKPSAFEIPVPISSELATFLGKTEKNAMECRANVNKAIWEYIHTHNLSNKQIINADAKLRKLLNLAEGEELRIFTLQNKLKHHYPKKA